MDERTQIKFQAPDIDGTPRPETIYLEENEPIEGTSENENGDSFTWHKWLCTENKYFMATDQLNAMLKAMPNKLGNSIKIEKVINPKGGFPYFTVNGLSKNDIERGAFGKTSNEAPPLPVISDTESSLSRLEEKLDKVISMLSKNEIDTKKEEGLPF